MNSFGTFYTSEERTVFFLGSERTGYFLRSLLAVKTTFILTRRFAPRPLLRFLFSDEYLSHVPRNLALNLYTAVTNPITLEGRVRLCAGALKHRDMQGVLKNLKVPLIAMQSTENVFVNASNVDSLLEGRNASHVWSHQLNLNLPEDQNCYSTQSLESLLGALNRKRGAMVVFVRAGHALQQESKRSVVDLLDVLACPTPAYTGIEVPEVMEVRNGEPRSEATMKGATMRNDVALF